MDWNALYDQIEKEQDLRKRHNFSIFMDTLSDEIGKSIDNITMVLDEGYIKNDKDYEWRLSTIKAAGYRVFRNKEGKHLIKRK